MTLPATAHPAILSTLRSITGSDLFKASNRQRRFLEFVVDETLAGRGERLNGYAIGVEVFDKPTDFDPTTDAIVRVEAGRLRSKLVEYYSRTGNADPVEILVPRGGYTPEFRFRSVVQASVEPSAVPPRALSPVDHGTALAILPFENLNGSPDEEYFCEGLADDLITALLKISGFTVVSRYSSSRYRRPLEEDPVTIASTLGVDYLLTGSVRHAGRRIRISLQLVDGPTGHALWSQHYDDAVDNVFEVQDRVVGEVATFLRDALTPNEQTRLARRGTRNLAAFEAYMKGCQEASRPAESIAWIERAEAHFNQAFATDPTYGEALARLSRLELARLGNWVGDARVAMMQLKRYAEDAVRISPDSALSHIALASARVNEHRFDEAMACAASAVQLEPGAGEVVAVAGLVYAQGGQLAAGLELLERGLRTDLTMNPIHAWAAGMVYFAVGDYAAGQAALLGLMQKVPVLLAANLLLAAHSAMLGDEAMAAAQLRYAHAALADRVGPTWRWSGSTNWREAEIRERMEAAVAMAYAAADESIHA